VVNMIRLVKVFFCGIFIINLCCGILYAAMGEDAMPDDTINVIVQAREIAKQEYEVYKIEKEKAKTYLITKHEPVIKSKVKSSKGPSLDVVFGISAIVIALILVIYMGVLSKRKKE